MKKLLLITLLGVFVSGFTIAQSEETRSLSSFSRISANEGIDVFIKKGSTEEARVVARNIDLEDVATDVNGSTLKIHIDNNWKNNNNVDVEVYVTYKSIDALAASSAGSIEAEDDIEVSGDFDVDVSSAGDIRASITADELSIEASSAGDVTLTVDVNEIEADASSSGDIELSGSAKVQDVEVSSSGDYDAYDVEGEEAEVSASSGGSVKINVSQRIDARASSGGSVKYKGSPEKVNANSSSGGSVRKY